MKLLICLSFLLMHLTILAEKKPKGKEIDFYLEYSTSTKTILIIGTSITIQEWIEEYDNPTSSMPSSRKEEIKTAVISLYELTQLKEFVKSSGFLKLPKNEYGGSPENRYYPYTIFVKIKSKQKKVLYRSNPDPSSEVSPEAFNKVEKKIKEILVTINEKN